MAYVPKYTTLDSVKLWGRVNGMDATREDGSILLAIARAEEAIDCACGTSFEAATRTRNAEIAFVDGDGWLHCQMYHPIAAVTSFEILDKRAGGTTYKLATPTMTEVLRSTLDYPDAAPDSDSYWFESLVPTVGPRETGSLRVKVTYDSGFATIPGAIESTTNRCAWWFFKIREAPMGRVATLTLPVMEVPLDFPPDVKATCKTWARLNA